MDSTINSALQRNHIYEAEDEQFHCEFRKEWARLIEEESQPYRSHKFSTANQAHCAVIERIASALSDQFGQNLKGRRLRFGAELVGTGTTGPPPEQPVTFGANAAGRKADHGVFTQARSSTMEPKNGSGKEEKKTVVPSRGKILQFAGKMRARNLEGVR